uniref:Uncharacterized protein n=1 Tax=Oryza barthii TaxID=65489 RepID=A0A0D3HNX8_9ORYZ
MESGVCNDMESGAHDVLSAHAPTRTSALAVAALHAVTMPIHKKFTDNNIHIHRAAHRTDNNTNNLLGQQQQIPVNIFKLQQQLTNAKK